MTYQFLLEQTGSATFDAVEFCVDLVGAIEGHLNLGFGRD